MRNVPKGKYDWIWVPEQWPLEFEQRIDVHLESAAELLKEWCHTKFAAPDKSDHAGN